MAERRCGVPLVQELGHECKWQKFKWGFSAKLCEELPKCWATWKARWRPSKEATAQCALNEGDGDL
jgi:hypothetical protein